MVLNSADILVDALRETSLLRTEQFNQLVAEFAPRFEDPQELANHIVGLGWITVYQAKKLLNGQGADLTLGHYLILDKLGEGGMGKVYKARQIRLSRTVALKVVRPDLLSNELALKRFQREAKAAALLAHPNIVRLFDADQVGDRHFLAMEFVEGTDLAELVKQSGPLSVGMACSFIRQAAVGLEHAHGLGLIHRDIKPSNLLVAAPAKTGRLEAGGVVKVLDMGLALLGRKDGDEASTLTQDGTVVGTPDFMAPEQAKNSSLVDARSDLYSLGCTLYYLLTGQAPFPHGTTLEKLLQHQIDHPQPIQKLRANVPDGVAAIVHSLLAKKPEDRFQTGATLATALAAFSVFDAKNGILKTGPKLPRRVHEPEALPVPCSPISASINPFRIETAEPDLNPEPEPKPEAEVPAPTALAPITLASEPVPVTAPTRPKRNVRRSVGIAGGFLVLVAWVLYAAGIFNNKDSSAKDDAASDEQYSMQEPARTPSEIRALDLFLPADTEIVAVLNVQQLNQSKFFQDNVLPKLGEFVSTFKTGAGIDPFRSVERAIVAVPADSSPAVIVIHGADSVSPGLLSWAKKNQGMNITSETIPGTQGAKRDIYHLQGKKDAATGNTESLYAAVLSSKPSAIVLSASKERVIEALARIWKTDAVAFQDPTIRSMLAKYPKATDKQSTLWLCAGAQSRVLLPFDSNKREKGSPVDSGITSLIASFRLNDTQTMMFELDVEANTKEAAAAAKDAVTGFFTLASAANKNDLRWLRLAELLQSANLTTKKKDAANPNIHQWWRSVSSDKLADWFAPFMEAIVRN